jgi:UDP-2,3-diacylglucosamine pyrophosphatase LpxH
MEILFMVKRYIQLLLFFLLFIGKANAQELPFKVFLVGDAGEVGDNKTTMNSLRQQLAGDAGGVVIFLGDNSYKNALGGLFPYGFKGFDSSTLTKNNILSQLDILKNYKGSVYFIPGNHDWWNLENYKVGKSKLKMEENFVEKNLKNNQSIVNPDNTFLPKDGNPGPDYVVVNHKTIRIIFIDTYRLIMQDFTKNPSGYQQTEKKFYDNLEQILEEAKQENQKVIVAAHHPVFYDGLDSETIRDPYILSRIKASSINFPSYKKMALHIRAILKKYPGLYYVSGHVHALQYTFPADGIHYIISGAGSKTLHVSESKIKKHIPNRDHEYSRWNTRGFFEIDFYQQSEKIFMYYEEGQKKTEIQQYK